MTKPRTDALADSEPAPDAEWEDAGGRPPTLPLLGGSAVLSAVLMLLPAYFLAWFWPGVPHGATCDLVHQPGCRPGFGLPQWYAVAIACVASCCLHVATFVRWPLPAARRLSVCALASAVVALLLATVARPWLSGVLPHTWFA
ncbi:MAG TPA: hypothetical protein VH915_02455 [Pedococcus sp.]|jgi:hypothetical protein